MLFLYQLPAAILGEIFSYLSADTVSQSSCLNQAFYQVVSSMSWYWRKKFNLYFPFEYDTKKNDLKQGELYTQASDSGAQWYSVFVEMAKEDYENFQQKYLSKAFRYVKESDLSRLKVLAHAHRKLQGRHLLFVKDEYKKNLVYWAQRSDDQPLLDYFYRASLHVYELEWFEYLLQRDTQGIVMSVFSLHMSVDDMTQIPWALYWAVSCRQNSDEIRKLREDLRLSKKRCSREGHRLIHLAALEDNIELISQILEETSHQEKSLRSFYKCDNTKRQTPLLLAARMGRIKTVQFILQQPGIDLGRAGINEALKLAIDDKSPTAYYLLKFGGYTYCDITLKCNILSVLIQQGQVELFRVCIEKHPELLYSDIFYSYENKVFPTSWDDFLKEQKYLRILEQIKHYTALDLSQNIALKPLILAVLLRQIDILKYILNLPYIDLEAAQGSKALFLALQVGNYTSAICLINAGAMGKVEKISVFRGWFQLALRLMLSGGPYFSLVFLSHKYDAVLLALLHKLPEPSQWIIDRPSEKPKAANDFFLNAAVLKSGTQYLMKLYEYMYRICFEKSTQTPLGFFWSVLHHRPAEKNTLVKLKAAYTLLQYALGVVSGESCPSMQYILSVHHIISRNRELKKLCYELDTSIKQQLWLSNRTYTIFYNQPRKRKKPAVLTQVQEVMVLPMLQRSPQIFLRKGIVPFPLSCPSFKR